MDSSDMKVRIKDPVSDSTEPLSPSKRKLSRKMVTMMAYLHDDGKYCPRTINEHCPEHEDDDMKLAEMMGNGGQPMDLNSIPGFPGVGGMGGIPGLSGGLGGMSSMNFPPGTADIGGMMGGGLNLSGLGGDMSFAGGDMGMAGLSMAGLGGDLAAGLGGDLGMGMGGMGMPGLSGGMGMPGLGGEMGTSVLGNLGLDGMGNQLGLEQGVSWPYDAATQMQLTGMSQDPGGGFNESVSRDSGLGFESGGVDNLSNGLNSMGLGGRGFPSYGNQGFPGGGFGGFPGGLGSLPGLGPDFATLGRMPQSGETGNDKGLDSLPPGAPAFFPSFSGNRSGIDMTTALRYQEELMRLRLQKRQQEARKLSLVNAARILQHRGSQSRSRLGIMMANNLNKEKEKTEEYEKECKKLRSEIDEQHKIRMEAFEFKMQPIVINEEPSRKANYKIQGAKLQYDIYALCLRLRDNTFRAEHEEKRRENVEKEVNKLRDKISELKVKISTITKGVPMTKIDVRDDKKEGRSSSVATSHTARSRKSVKEDARARALEEECSPERREKLMNMMEAEKKKDQSPDGRRSPLRILKSQQRSAREILMT